MGTHRYFLQMGFVDIRKKNPSVHFNNIIDRGMYYENIVPFLSRKVRGNYKAIYTCRESIVSHSKLYLEKYLGNSKRGRLVIKFRCFGEMYTKVSRIIKPKNHEKLQETLYNLTGLKLQIDSGEIPDRTEFPSEQRILGNSHFTVNGELIPTNGFVDITLNLWEQSQKLRQVDLLISCVLAIFREPLIIKAIISEKIVDKPTFGKFMCNFCENRFSGKDLSYNCYSLYGGDRCTKSECRSLLRTFMKHRHNSDGSDYFSMLLLTMFLVNINDMKESLIGGSTGTGPVTAILSQKRFSIDEFVEKFKKIISKDSPIVDEVPSLVARGLYHLN